MPDEQEPQSDTQTSDAQTNVRRADDFLSLYANNVVADGTAWDLRLTFGQFDRLLDGSLVNNQRLSVTMPLALAKLMIFWIEVQIAAHEVQVGRPVGMRPDVLPDAPLPIPPANQNDENYIKLRDRIISARERLIASLE